MIIRPFSPEDCEAITALFIESHRDDATQAGALALLGRNHQGPFLWAGAGEEIYVALINESIVGAIVARAMPGSVHILSLFTAPHFRRRGVARSLLEHVAAGKPNRATLELAVYKNNGAALAFYQAMGFGQIGERHVVFNNTRTTLLIMRRNGPHFYRPSPA